MYIATYLIIYIYWWFPLLVILAIHTIILIATVVLISFIYFLHSVCKGQGLRSYISFIWYLICLIPMGIRIGILLRLLLFISSCYADISDFVLNASGSESEYYVDWASGSIARKDSLPFIPGGGGNGPSNEGPPANMQDSVKDSVLAKLNLQFKESTTGVYKTIYSKGLPIDAQLSSTERNWLSTDINEKYRLYPTSRFKTVPCEFGTRVVKVPENYNGTSSLTSVKATLEFINYVKK